jgi:hypothetical protein
MMVNLLRTAGGAGEQITNELKHSILSELRMDESELTTLVELGIAIHSRLVAELSCKKLSDTMTEAHSQYVRELRSHAKIGVLRQSVNQFESACNEYVVAASLVLGLYKASLMVLGREFDEESVQQDLDLYVNGAKTTLATLKADLRKRTLAGISLPGITPRI